MTESKKPTPPTAGPNATSPVNSPAAACPAGCPGASTFSALGKKWGWDDYTTPTVPWMSVQTGKTDTVKANAAAAAEAGRMCNVTYESSDATIATVSPSVGTGDGQTLTITGVKKGEATISAKCGGSEVGKFKVSVKDLIRKTLMVRVVNETNYTSTAVPLSTIEAYLKTIYNQSVVEFSVTLATAKTVAFDTDASGNVDVSGSWPSADVTRIVTAAGDKSYDFNAFLVDKPNDGSLGWSGFSNPEQAAVIHVDNSSEPENTIAHEMGHGLFGLAHSAGADSANLMHATAVGTSKLRKSQWDHINP